MGKQLFKILAVPLLYLISRLPFPLLYSLSTGVKLVVFNVIGYRKHVIMENLRRSFPAMNEQEIQNTARQFHTHFCDVIFETVKLLTITPAEFRRRCVMTDNAISTYETYFRKNQTVVGVMGHCGNWEWGAIAHQIYFRRLITGVYDPLSNKNFDQLMLRLRGRFGGDIVPMQGLYRRLVQLRQQGISTTIGLIADQTPPPESAYWLTFLNQDTPVFNGPEKLARKFNYPVFFMSVTKTGRGRYRLDTHPITDDPSAMEEGRISEMHSRLLEQNILEVPHAWLWSHRRWKHKKPAAKTDN